MSLHPTTNTPVDGMPKRAFGCMENYFVIVNDVHPKTHLDMVGKMQNCLEKLTSKKFTKQLTYEISLVLAMMRVFQFVAHFNSFEGQKVRDGPGMRKAEETCGCDVDEHTMVIQSGCKDCCINWPKTVHKCECDEILLTDCISGAYAKNGCMHPGDWNTELVLETEAVLGLCLVCGQFDVNGPNVTMCTHNDLHTDIHALEGRIAWAPDSPYSIRLESILSKDVAQKTKEDQVASAVEAIAKQRLARHPDNCGLKRKAGMVET